MTDDDYLAGGAYVSDLEAPVTTQRLRLDLAYDGAGFHGWAQQPGLRTVEGEVGEALQTIFRIPMKLTVAGRTDAGVHAAAQVASVLFEALAAPRGAGSRALSHGRQGDL